LLVAGAGPLGWALATISFDLRRTVLSPDNLAPREHLSQVVRGASWLAAGMVYVLVSVVALPAADAGARSGQR